jgi:hypothetical protein
VQPLPPNSNLRTQIKIETLRLNLKQMKLNRLTSLKSFWSSKDINSHTYLIRVEATWDFSFFSAPLYGHLLRSSSALLTLSHEMNSVKVQDLHSPSGRPRFWWCPPSHWLLLLLGLPFPAKRYCKFNSLTQTLKLLSPYATCSYYPVPLLPLVLVKGPALPPGLTHLANPLSHSA